MSIAMRCCAEKNIENVFFTMWGDDGKECSFYSLLPSLFAMRKIYEGITDEEQIKALFKEATGEDYDAMMYLDSPNLVSPNNDGRSTVSKVMLFNDPLIGIYDTVVSDGATEDYSKHAKTLYEYAKDSKNFSYLFEAMAALCDALSVKYDLGMRTRNAYANKDRKAMSAIVADYDRALELLEVFHKKFKALWMKENKAFGFEIQEIRLGGLMLRMRSAKEKLEEYALGKTDRIEEYDVELLEHAGEGSAEKMPRMNSWGRISSVDVITW